MSIELFGKCHSRNRQKEALGKLGNKCWPWRFQASPKFLVLSIANKHRILICACNLCGLGPLCVEGWRKNDGFSVSVALLFVVFRSVRHTRRLETKSAKRHAGSASVAVWSFWCRFSPVGLYPPIISCRFGAPAAGRTAQYQRNKTRRSISLCLCLV